MSSENPAPADGSRSGPLRNGNPRGNPNAAPRCGARTRASDPCRQPALGNGRCRLHGGKSTGPRTEAGKAAACAAHITHGYYTGDASAFRHSVRDIFRQCRLACRSVKA
jgi:hypothetical protein